MEEEKASVGREKEKREHVFLLFLFSSKKELLSLFYVVVLFLNERKSSEKNYKIKSEGDKIGLGREKEKEGGKRKEKKVNKHFSSNE